MKSLNTVHIFESYVSTIVSTFLMEKLDFCIGEQPFTLDLFGNVCIKILLKLCQQIGTMTLYYGYYVEVSMLSVLLWPSSDTYMCK